jgi:hypothetical protein
VLQRFKAKPDQADFSFSILFGSFLILRPLNLGMKLVMGGTKNPFF